MNESVTEVLYLSCVSSERVIDQLKTESGMNPGYAGQKFDRLIIKGIINNSVSCSTLSSIPISIKMSKKIIWRLKDESENGIYYRYIPFLNLPIIRNICLFLYTFFYISIWSRKNPKNKCVIEDVLNYSICYGSLFASKLTGIKRIGVVTDMPGLMVNASINTSTNRLKNFIRNIGILSVRSYDGYVFLTKQMNSVINKKNKPYIIMEGLVDSKIVPLSATIAKKRQIVYAGGLHERYGLKTLVDSFRKINDPNLKLIIFGSGPYAGELEKVMLIDNRIEYKGVVPNDIVVRTEEESLLLINPRPTHEQFTQFSFPSKNMEYIASGTPLLTTVLPGMPEEYYDHVFLLHSETVEGFVQVIEDVLKKSNSELSSFGQKAQRWILNNKINNLQSKRILLLISQV